MSLTRSRTHELFPLRQFQTGVKLYESIGHLGEVGNRLRKTFKIFVDGPSGLCGSLLVEIDNRKVQKAIQQLGAIRQPRVTFSITRRSPRRPQSSEAQATGAYAGVRRV